MTTTNTGTTNFDKTVQTLINKVLETELLPELPHLRGGYIKATFVKGTNSTMRFLRVPFATPTTNAGVVSAGTAPWLTEGTAPTAKALSIGYEEFTAYQAGQRWELTDVALMESPLDLMAKASEVCARDAAETADEYVGRILAAGTNVLYAGSGNTQRTDVAASDVITGSLVRRAAQNLKAEATGDKAKSEAMLAEMEKNGTRVKPEYGSVWFHLMGADKDHVRQHVTVALPGATTATTGLPENGRGGGAWIMNAGTSTAHLMVPGE